MRPPLMSKTALLLFLQHLHEAYCNLDHENAAVKQKSILDCIEICIENSGEFRGWSDSIKDALTQMLEIDSLRPLPRGIMRTAIRATQTYPELRKFVLSFLMPKLMKMKVWVTSPKVWDGIVVGVKALTMSKDAEATLRAVLGVNKYANFNRALAIPHNYFCIAPWPST